MLVDDGADLGFDGPTIEVKHSECRFRPVRRLLLLFLLVPVFAGCVTSSDAPFAAQDAVRRAQALADERFDVTLFLGVMGTEGPRDDDAYAAALTGDATGEAYLQVFDHDVPTGAFGDGDPGTWFTSHFAYRSQDERMGTLITQVFPDGAAPRTVFAPFMGPLSSESYLVTRTMWSPWALPQAPGTLLGLMLDVGTAMAWVDQDSRGEGTGPVLCTIRTDTDAWNVTAVQAAATALASPVLQEHMRDHVDGELTYFYLPRITVEDDCPAHPAPMGNYWSVMHTDLDAFLDPGRPDPEIAEVRVDAADGALLSEVVRPSQPDVTVRVDRVLDITDDVLPDPTTRQVHRVLIEVPTGAAALDVRVDRQEAPHGDGLADARYVLVAPTGYGIAGQDFHGTGRHDFHVSDPMAGTWALEYSYRPVAPQGHHVVAVHAEARIEGRTG